MNESLNELKENNDNINNNDNDNHIEIENENENENTENENDNTDTEDQLKFDFDFDDLDDDTSDDHDDDDINNGIISNNCGLLNTSMINKPYQWGTNIQFVNMDLNKMSLKQRASNSLSNHFYSQHQHYHKNKYHQTPSFYNKPSLSSQHKAGSHSGLSLISHSQHSQPSYFKQQSMPITNHDHFQNHHNNMIQNPNHYTKLCLSQKDFSEKESNIEFDEEKKLCYTDDEDDGLCDFEDDQITSIQSITINTFENNDNINSRQLSQFDPQTYDICSFMSFPLDIDCTHNDHDVKDKPLLEVDIGCLEYLRSYLPDFTEFNNYLYDILYQSGFQLRYANYVGTIENISNLNQNGGSKIIHFIAYIWNPFNKSIDDNDDDNKNQHPLQSTFPTNDDYYKCDTDYILIESPSFNKAKGKWIKVEELSEKINFNTNLNDIIIVISPQSIKLSQIFSKTFGYKYVIGVECGSNNYSSFSSSEPAIFLKYFYSSIFNQECIDRAFELAKTAAILQRQGFV